MARASSIRLALFYVALFLVVGVLLPFWPVWLASRDMDPAQIGILLSTPLWARIIGNPLIARIADRRGDRKRPLIVLAAISLAAYALFAFAHGFWPLFGISILSGVALSAMVPLGENLTLLTVYSEKLDYGRIRLWGSIAFMAGAYIAGRLLVGRSEDLILWLLLGSIGLSLLASAGVPDTRAPPGAPVKAPMRALLRHPTFLLFLLATGMIQSSHTIYYGFGTLHWLAAGYAADTISLFWAEAVAVEVVLFAASGWLIRRLPPPQLILIAAVAGVVRWSLTALGTGLGLLIVAQTLHSLTFAAAHLGAMHFMARASPPGTTATAQTLYSAVAIGLLAGTTMLGSGALYAAIAGDAFFVMAGMSALGGAAAVALGRRWDGGQLRI